MSRDVRTKADTASHELKATIGPTTGRLLIAMLKMRRSNAAVAMVSSYSTSSLVMSGRMHDAPTSSSGL